MKRVIPWEIFHKEWEHVEPPLKSVLAVIDTVMADVIMCLSDESTEMQATELLHSRLYHQQGRLPTWMPPEFWKVEFAITPTRVMDRMVIHGRQYNCLPTVLSGKNLEFYPLDGKMKVEIRDMKLFIVADNVFEAIVGLARIIEARH